MVLRQVHRYGGAIAELAGAIQHGDADEAVAVLEAGTSNVQWIAHDASATSLRALDDVRSLAVDCGRAVREAAKVGDAPEALTALGRFRLLCAHRRGPGGVATWMGHVETWLRAEVEGFTTGTEWYVGRPLIVTENDYGLQLYNGDTGVVVAAPDGRLVASFARGARSRKSVRPGSPPWTPSTP